MNNRHWSILCWNIRGLNATEKHDAARDKIEESGCSVICLQETKMQHIDMQFLRKFTPRRFDKYDFIPSSGASGGILCIWNSAVFVGTTVDKQSFGLTISFTSQHNLATWNLTIVYGPCLEPARSHFVNWLNNHCIDLDSNWLFLGDFNFYRSLDDRNKPGGNIQDTLIFNDLIGHLGLIGLPLKGRSFTWSNMQLDPLLEQLDWFFTSINWTLDYPNSMITPLAKITSDHVPCKITIATSIPKSNIFRFENFWPQHPGFSEAVHEGWTCQVRNQRDSANIIAGKLKTQDKNSNHGASTCQISPSLSRSVTRLSCILIP